MNRSSLRKWVGPLSAFAMVAALFPGAPLGTPSTAKAEPPSGFRALHGAEAAASRLPVDVELVRTLPLTAYNLTYERYQQVYGPKRANVLGGQLSLYKDAGGGVAMVIGAHYPGITASNTVRLSPADALRIADRDLGGPGASPAAVPLAGDVAARIEGPPERHTDLRIAPDSGRYFYQVESRAFDSRWIHWIDADQGAVIQKYDALANACLTGSHTGTGVKGDSKDMPGLTTCHDASGHGATGSHYDLASGPGYGGRQLTYDARNRSSLLYYVTDADDNWNVSGRSSPGHPAMVDAQYYAEKTDDYYTTIHTAAFFACHPGGMKSVGHYGKNYNNAFWNGTYMVYGDGDGTSFREFSGGLDVVAHELSHGVTECFSNLAYQNESGALNEAFSDIMGNSVEFFVNEDTASGCFPSSNSAYPCADWWIAEDVSLASDDTVPGFRNMADPSEDGDPDHYSERYIGTSDNGGVHTNSGIVNHAYYLLVNGGHNAGCLVTPRHDHCSADPVVTKVGLSNAQRIFFLGFTGLTTENATMADARAATVAAANTLLGVADGLTNAQLVSSTSTAWAAVGVATPPPPDTTPPTVTINQADQADPTSASPINFTVVFSEAVTGFATGDVTLSGTAGATTGTVTGSGATYNVAVSGMTSDGTVVASVGAGVAIDAASNPNTASTSADNTVTYNVPIATGMHVGDLDGVSVKLSRSAWRAQVTATVHDSSHGSLSGAVVTGTFFQSGVSVGSADCTTISGSCVVNSPSLKGGSATFTVSAVTLTGQAYTPGDNHDPDGDSNGTTITVSK